MKLGIMQPYFMPYVGYFQLINVVDKFVVYDNIQYTKKGWINRNRVLQNCQPAYISLPLRQGSDFLDIQERSLAESWAADRTKLLNKVKELYRKAPYFAKTYPILETCLYFDSADLFDFIFNSIQVLCNHLMVETTLLRSSSILVDHQLKGEERVIAICSSMGTPTYINPIGGIELYSKDVFQRAGIELNFIESMPFEYSQFDCVFVPWLSILDVLMFVSHERIKEYLDSGFRLI